MSQGKGWIGVDLDGTLATYGGWKPDGGVGDPVPAMVSRVRQWLQEGRDVRIMTARVCPNDLTGPDGPLAQRPIIEAWCLANLGKVLPITATKDYQMVELWDDRAVGVIPNTGQQASASDLVTAAKDVMDWINALAPYADAGAGPCPVFQRLEAALAPYA